jgi:hypothetical protein
MPRDDGSGLLTGAEARGLSATFHRSMATVAECLEGLFRIVVEQDAEIRRLRAELARAEKNPDHNK